MRPAVDLVYGAPHLATSLDAWVGLLAFYGQLYFDFSGYTDIGRGSAQLLGYRVPSNFNAPYLATTFQDFWRRWHMSLSSWIRDYVYIPLGGSRLGERRSRINVMIAMALAGLWHGAAWHFMFFGIVCGLGVLVDRVLKQRLWPNWTAPTAIKIAAGWVLTQAMWLVALDFFRASSFSDVFVLWSKMLRFSLHHYLTTPVQILDVPVLLAALLLTQLAVRNLKPRELIAPKRMALVLRPAYVTLLMSMFFFFSALAPVTRFIYFQF
jgi:alginate O-acetyltransferase complex protein AlgI